MQTKWKFRSKLSSVLTLKHVSGGIQEHALKWKVSPRQASPDPAKRYKRLCSPETATSSARGEAAKGKLYPRGQGSKPQNPICKGSEGLSRGIPAHHTPSCASEGNGKPIHARNAFQALLASFAGDGLNSVQKIRETPKNKPDWVQEVPYPIQLQQSWSMKGTWVILRLWFIFGSGLMQCGCPNNLLLDLKCQLMVKTRARKTCM